MNDDSVALFAASLTDDSLKQDQIVALVARSNVLNASLGMEDSQAQTAHIKLACEISKLAFSKAQIMNEESYVDSANVQYFRDRTEVNWSELCWLPARCIVAPRDTPEVSTILKIVKFTNVKFAVRGGGHNPNPGWGSVDSTGLLIDLYLLTTLELSRGKDILRVGPANRWNDVYQYLNGTGISVAGGRVAEVGVSGLLLGGGLSYFPSEFGLSCDSVQNFEVILGNSTVINANAETNTDLFSSLKGGGANFGIVTRFDLHTRQFGQIWFEVNQYEASQISRLLEALVDYQAAAEMDTKAGMIFSPSLNTTTVGLLYAAPTLRPPIFRSFYSIPAYKVLVPSTIGTEAEVSAGFASSEIGPTRYDIVAASTKVDLELYRDIYTAFISASYEFSKATGGSLGMSFQPLTSRAVLKGREQGGNALDLAPLSSNWFTAVASWTAKASDKLAHDTVVRLGNEVIDLTGPRNLRIPQLNPNDATYSQRVLSSFGQWSLRRLRLVSAKYDPDQVFQKLQHGGFLLRHAFR